MTKVERRRTDGGARAKAVWGAARFLMAAVIVLMAVATVTAAPAPIPPQPPSPAQEGFVPVQDVPPDEQFPAAPLVIAAYAVAWIAVVLYLWSIWQRLARVEREMAAVSRRLQGGVRQ